MFAPAKVMSIVFRLPPSGSCGARAGGGGWASGKRPVPDFGVDAETGILAVPDFDGEYEVGGAAAIAAFRAAAFPPGAPAASGARRTSRPPPDPTS